MGQPLSTPQEPDPRDQPTDPGTGPAPCPGPQTTTGQTLNIGPLLAQTLAHFFPDFKDWVDAIHDPRFKPFITYHKRFLLHWGLMLFLCKLGSRRQLDYQFNTDGPEVLTNLNRLASTQQDTRPVNKTLERFVSGIGSAAIAGLRQHMIHRLIRMKALDEARLQGRFVILIDGSGFLTFKQRHCPYCLTQQHGETTVYMHQVLEAKLLGPGNTVLSVATEFIDNRDLEGLPEGASAEQRKQDCELKALRRLLPRLRQAFPQLRICLSGDALNACGAGLQIAQEGHCDYVYGFKPGRLPALWQDFQGLLSLCPEQRVELTTPTQVRQVYRWVNDLAYQDSVGREWKFTAIHCQEINKRGEESTWAWLTSLEVNQQTVMEVAHQGGRQRWRIENEGFNTQKNSGLNLEHAYSHKNWQAYYYLLQIAHILLQLLEKGSLLRKLAQQQGQRTAVRLYGSLKHMAEILLDSLRYLHWPEEAFDATVARHRQIRLDSS
jgi:hypothetical protein